ncbi:MBT domain-containing protein 1-like [Artemia franciscana]|uniref:Polycomb protein Sfmbt n=1 Tax=Artemia franciscana TaxID=6661 RepID=A0AA88HTF3_ARTSF|nr:hypothetical protein QYM36_010158 [Artemia franciscana]
MTTVKKEKAKLWKPTSQLMLAEVPSSYYKREDIGSMETYDWLDYLNTQNLLVANASLFKHAPLPKLWLDLEKSMSHQRTYVAVLHASGKKLDAKVRQACWIAKIMKLAGYKCLVRPLGSEDASCDFWIHLCSSDVHSLEMTTSRKLTFLPPQSLKQRNPITLEFWESQLEAILKESHSIPSNLQSIMAAESKSKFTVGLRVEVVDKRRLSHVRPAIVETVVGGRLKLLYEGDSLEDFWCSDESQWLHPVGWAKSVNHALIAKGTYHERCEEKVKLEDDAPFDLFQTHPFHSKQDSFKEGMKLEVIDPLNLKEICAATICQVLKDGYIVIRVDSYEDDKPTNRFCFHITNFNLFYVGFCEENGITINPPYGYKKGNFRWTNYLKNTHSKPVTKDMIQREEHPHDFVIGMKLEAVDLMNPYLICVATVVNVIGRLLRIRFDGWGEAYDHWTDCQSPDIYPLGYCEMIGYPLTGPPLHEQCTSSGKPSRKRSISPMVYKKDQKSIKNEKLLPVRKKLLRKGMHLNTIKKTENDSPELPKSLQKLDLIEETNSSTGKNFKMDLKSSILADKEKEKAYNPFKKVENRIDSKEDEFEGNKREVAAIKLDYPSVTEKCNGTVTIEEASSKEFIIPQIPGNITSISAYRNVTPSKWGLNEVCKFLEVNGINYCNTALRSQNITGEKLLKLSQNEIKTLTGNKLGPTLKFSGILKVLVKIGEYEKAIQKTS